MFMSAYEFQLYSERPMHRSWRAIKGELIEILEKPRAA